MINLYICHIRNFASHQIERSIYMLNIISNIIRIKCFRQDIYATWYHYKMLRATIRFLISYHVCKIINQYKQSQIVPKKKTNGLTLRNKSLLSVMYEIRTGILQTDNASTNKRTTTCHCFILNPGSASTKDIVSSKHT
jgi:hypothetical protein